MMVLWLAVAAATNGENGAEHRPNRRGQWIRPAAMKQEHAALQAIPMPAPKDTTRHSP